MKQVKAIIQPHMLNKVLDALHDCEHFPGITISDCQGQGRGRGPGGRYEAQKDTIFLAKKVAIDVWCDDAVAEHLAHVIKRAAHTGNAGDGVVAVGQLEQLLQIRDDEGKR